MGTNTKKPLSLDDWCSKLPPEHIVNVERMHVQDILKCLYFRILNGEKEEDSENWWEAEKIREALKLLGVKDKPKRSSFLEYANEWYSKKGDPPRVNKESWHP